MDRDETARRNRELEIQNAALLNEVNELRGLLGRREYDVSTITETVQSFSPSMVTPEMEADAARRGRGNW